VWDPIVCERTHASTPTVRSGVDFYDMTHIPYLQKIPFSNQGVDGQYIRINFPMAGVQMAHSYDPRLLSVTIKNSSGQTKFKDDFTAMGSSVNTTNIYDGASTIALSQYYCTTYTAGQVINNKSPGYVTYHVDDPALKQLMF